MNLYKSNTTKPCATCCKRKCKYMKTVACWRSNRSFHCGWCDSVRLSQFVAGGLVVGSDQRPGHRLAGWLGCVFWALVSILFKPGPWPQTSRKPFITLCREGNVGKNQADHVAPSLATESWPAPFSSPAVSTPRQHPLAHTNSFHTPGCFFLSLSLSKGFSTYKEPVLDRIPKPNIEPFQVNLLLKKGSKESVTLEAISANICWTHFSLSLNPCDWHFQSPVSPVSVWASTGPSRFAGRGSPVGTFNQQIYTFDQLTQQSVDASCVWRRSSELVNDFGTDLLHCLFTTPD